MPLVLGIILIILVLSLVGFIIYQNKNFKRESIQNEIENCRLKEEIKESRNKFEDSCTRYDGLMNQFLRADEKVNLLQSELIQLQSSIQVDAVKNDAAENLDNILAEKNNELAQLNASAELANSAVQEKLARLEELEASIRALEGRIEGGKKEWDDLEAQIKLMTNDLNDLAALKASVLAVEEGVGNVWELTPGKNQHLIELIHELVDTYGGSYPILQKELLKVEWSIVWLPQLQQLCLRENLDRSGIYKLTSKDNDKVVYIGQAVSIKDRWYTHCKKMLGVEAKGTERLYDFRPDELTWEVVEFKNGNLDADEKYWIDYFKCREIGLNKKR